MTPVFVRVKKPVLHRLQVGEELHAQVSHDAVADVDEPPVLSPVQVEE